MAADPATVPPTSVTPAVSLAGVHKTYHEVVPVYALVDADCTIDQGEYVSIVGVSGSGKSTLLHIIGLLDRPTSGSHHHMGVDVDELRPAAVAGLRGRDVGFVFQAFHLIPHRTVLDNVKLAMLYTGIAAKERLMLATAAIAEVGLTHRTTFLPAQLSGGERQRVAVARAVVARPRLVLADEPTGNLDRGTGKAVLSLFSRLREDYGLTLVVVTHDPEVAARADRVIHVEDGRVRNGRP